MKKQLLTLSLLILIAFTGKSQTWEKLFSGKSTDVFRSVIEATSGGYIAVGYRADSTANDTDAYAVKLNTNGDTAWTFTYNGPLSKKDLFYKVMNTIDGGYALCGYTTSVTGNSDDALYLKLNSSGQLQWVKFYGGSGKERAQDIIQTADGKYAIVGYTTSSPAQYYDAFFIRTNSTGDTLWTRRYGAANYDDANSVQVLTDGGFILGGQSNNGANGLDMFMVRTNSSGDTIWTKRNGSLQTDNIDCIRVLADGYIMAGSTNTLATGDDGNIVKTDTSGTIVWSKTYGGSAPDDFHRIEPTTGGGYVASGTTTSTGPLQPNMWLMRTNGNGDSLWSKTFGRDNHDHGYSAQQTSDGGYIIAGHTGSFGFNNEEAYVVKTDASGNVSNNLTYTTVSALITPNASTCGTTNMQIKLVIKNHGNETQASVPITVQITGSLTQTINQTYNSSFTPLESDTITLSTTINTSAGGTYTFFCYTSNNNDVYPARNSLTRTYTISPTYAAPTTTSNSRCGDGTVSLSAAAPVTIYWYTASTGGASMNTGTTYTTPTLSSTTTYYVQTGTTCPSARIPVVATINPISPDPVTTGASNCGSSALTLAATSADPVTWYDAPTGGTNVGTGLSYTTPVLTTTTNYYAQASNGLCPSNRVLVTAMISSVAADPVPTAGQRCGTGTVDLTAGSVDPVYWFDVSSGGSVLGSGLSFTTPSISTTTIFYVQADNGCLSNRVAVTATVNPLAADPVPTPGQNCGPGTVNVSATAADPIIWYDAATLGNQVGVGSALTTPSILTTTTYYAQANDGTCPSNRVAVAAVILPLPVVNLGNDTTVNAINYVIDAGAGFASYNWSTGQSTQNITITTPDTYCVTVMDANGCSNNDCVYVDLINGISTNPTSSSFALYPNPSSNNVTIELSPAFMDAEISVMNIIGEVVKQISTDNETKINMELASFAKGIYLVKIVSGNYSEIQKLIVE